MHGYVWYQLLKMPHVRRSQTKARYEEEKNTASTFRGAINYSAWYHVIIA